MVSPGPFRLPLFATFAALFAAAFATAAEPLRFDRDVRPILSQNCFQCHGPDDKTRAANLRLDDRASAIAKHDDTTPIVPGKPEASGILARILSDDPDTLMPPPKSKKTLTAAQKEVLRRWIAEGANYESHWAFQPLKLAAPPRVKQADWPQQPLDHFVLAELEKQGLAPSPEADRGTLLRRASLDLAGLLPSPEEVAAFEADSEPGAYERAVDRLLASPHYGERWGRHWLDQARYADSNGYTIDSERNMWPYRDWVIRALNDDLSFRDFTIQQLAGDLLPNATRAQRIATAFHRNTMINEEGGTDAEQFRNEIAVDRVNTTGAVWLGLTIGCAQCHSHKFDPISQREYYRLFAFFNQSNDANNKGETIKVAPGELLGMPPTDLVEEMAVQTAAAKMASLKKELPQRRTAWEKQLAETPPAQPVWVPLDIHTYTSEKGRKLQKLADGSILTPREGPGGDLITAIFEGSITKLTTIRVDLLPHDSLPGGGPGTGAKGGIAIQEIELFVNGEPVPLLHAVSDRELPKQNAGAVDDGDRKTVWNFEPERGAARPYALWLFLEQLIDVAGKKIELRIRHDGGEPALIGHFKVSGCETYPSVHPDAKRWEGVVAAAKKPAKDRSKEETNLLASIFQELDRELVAATRTSAKLSARDKSAALMVMKESDKGRTTFLLQRGDFLNPDKTTGPLTPGTPECMPPLGAASDKPTRLDLAKWLTRDDHPLTPRVAVNRVWMRLFGQGLVETENDFGTQGTPPSHPELLDHLAGELIRGGWSLKSLHRAVVTSATYRQSSRQRPELAAADPRNRLLGRQNRVRVDAEIVRDSALAASGWIDRSLGGPNVRPPQPEGVYAFTQNKKPWPVSQGAARYRRAMYVNFIRSAPYPLFSTFDAPNFSTVCTRRLRSNTPLQALLLANDEAFIELAQGLALRLAAELPGEDSDNDRRRIERAFRICYSRGAVPREAELALGYLARERARFAADTPAATAAAPPNLPVAWPTVDAAAWSSLCRGLMNSDEFITRE